MAASLFNGTELFERIVNTLSTDGPIGNLEKTVSEKKTFENDTILSRL